MNPPLQSVESEQRNRPAQQPPPSRTSLAAQRRILLAEHRNNILNRNHEQPVVPLELNGDRVLGVEQHTVVSADRIVLVVRDLRTDRHDATVSVGISILSGRWMPVLVVLRSSSLRISTRNPIGSTTSIALAERGGFFDDSAMIGNGRSAPRPAQPHSATRRTTRLACQWPTSQQLRHVPVQIDHLPQPQRVGQVLDLDLHAVLPRTRQPDPPDTEHALPERLVDLHVSDVVVQHLAR